jgi:hypothetical protein
VVMNEPTASTMKGMKARSSSRLSMRIRAESATSGRSSA